MRSSGMMWVAGVYRLYTVHGDEKVRSDSKPDVKGALLEDLGDVSGRRPATTPFFRFVSRDQLAQRLPDLRHML